MYNIKFIIERDKNPFEGNIFLRGEYIGRCFTRISSNHLEVEFVNDRYIRELSEITKAHFIKYPPIFDSDISIDALFNDLVFYERVKKVVNKCKESIDTSYLLVMTTNKRYIMTCDKKLNFAKIKKYLVYLFKNSNQRIRVMMIDKVDMLQ